MRASVVLALLTAFSPVIRAAADPALPTGEIVPEAPARPEPPADPAVQAHLPGCAVWTDRCVTCERAPAGRISCSNIGLVCQPQAVQCVRSEEPAEKETTRQEN